MSIDALTKAYMKVKVKRTNFRMEDFKEIKDAVKTAFDSPPATSKKNQKLYYDDNSNELQ